jgi:hypothetical protein
LQSLLSLHSSGVRVLHGPVAPVEKHTSPNENRVSLYTHFLNLKVALALAKNVLEGRFMSAGLSDVQ